MKPFKIKKIRAREILNSRGNPTVEVDLDLDSGIHVRASSPSGASRGKYEALELRDEEERYEGKGVLKAIENIEEVIAPQIEGKRIASQKEIDQFLKELDGTENKSNLGSNAICAVSLAVCRAGAKVQGLEIYQYIREIFQSTYFSIGRDYQIPVPSFNVINGGLHAGNRLDVQEFMIVPQETSFSQNLRIATEIYHRLKDLLFQRYGGGAINLGDEGGFAPPLAIPEQALDIILASAETLGYREKMKLILDVAASQFYEKNQYKMRTGFFTREGLSRYYSHLVSRYPISGLEDPFSEEDWGGFKGFTKEWGEKILVIGDDLLVTDPERIKKAQEEKAVNAMIVKINQIGTVSEALEAVSLGKEFGWKTMISHRSGETNDSFIADFAVGVKADFIKTGAPARGERIAKYNRLLRIEEELQK